MIRVFIGYDPRETIAAHVLQHSIGTRSSIPVSFTLLDRHNLKGIYDRPRGEFESTDFSLSRFIVPYLCNYEGWAVFMDCDMVCRGDIVELARYMTLASRWNQAVQVVKHGYIPREQSKFLGQTQTSYERKNWSSLMIFNNALCRNLTPEAVNAQAGLWLHRFLWTTDDKIGEIPKIWNYLVSENNQCAPEEARMIHFTNGGPWFKEYENCEFADLWRAERDEMNASPASAS
jgi:lipopolysaccharide biosynthesis glycosyltransferase